MKVGFAFILFLIIQTDSVKIPDYIKPCKKGPAGAQCVVKSANSAIQHIRNGVPELKLQGANPFRLDHVDFQATSQLNVKFSDVNVYGYDETVFTKGQIDDNGLELEFTVDKPTLIGKYDMDGKILIVPLNGQGNVNITGVGAIGRYKAKFSSVMQNGTKYYTIRNADSVGEVVSIKRMYFHFDNLFNGDPRLGPETNKFLNENWEDVYQTMKDSIEKIATYILANYYLNGMLKVIPVESLFDTT